MNRTFLDEPIDSPPSRPNSSPSVPSHLVIAGKWCEQIGRWCASWQWQDIWKNIH